MAMILFRTVLARKAAMNRIMSTTKAGKVTTNRTHGVITSGDIYPPLKRGPVAPF
jgi:hypothetical protein